MTTITATELARNTREILDRIASRGETFVVERNHAAIARILPSEPVMTAAEALEGLAPTVTPAQATRWLKDSRSRFDDTLRDPWA